MAAPAPARHPNDECWLPRCPRCGHSALTLAPANQYTKYVVAKAEVYCPECQWRAVLADVMKQVYVRV